MSKKRTQANLPLTPSVLRWARETTNLSAHDVAGKLKLKTITPDTIEAWERGEGSPSLPQLEKLAYEIYKRPLALFFFPEPPEEKTPRQAFRTLPDEEIENISPRLRYLLRQAQVRQIYLGQLYEGVPEPDRHILRDTQLNLLTPVEVMAARVRAYLEITLATQSQWRNTDEAFKRWRDSLEAHGVYVFKEAFHDDSISGFCVFDRRFPVIYVNNSHADARQIFTLFHELAHLLARTGGIDKLDDQRYIRRLDGDDKRIEVFCNQFAGEFLVPGADFDRRLQQWSQVSPAMVKELARIYHVSREVILRKLLDRRRITRAEYEATVTQWKEAAQTANDEKSGGGNYYLTQGVYLSQRYLELAFGQLYQGRLSVDQLAEVLGVKPKNVPTFEASLIHQGVVE